MPDDDYEEVRVGYECYDIPQTPACTCEHCSKIDAKKDKAKQIETLLGIMEYDFNTKFHPDVRNAFWYIHKIIKVLRLMNGIE